MIRMIKVNPSHKVTTLPAEEDDDVVPTAPKNSDHEGYPGCCTNRCCSDKYGRAVLSGASAKGAMSGELWIYLE